MSLLSRIRRLLPADFLAHLRDAGETENVTRSAIAHERASKYAAEVSQRSQKANHQLREAVRRVRSSTVT
jgi:hypothetical protein